MRWVGCCNLMSHKLSEGDSSSTKELGAVYAHGASARSMRE